MRPDLRTLARLFIETTGAPCLDEETTARGLAAVLEEHARISTTPFVNHVRARRSDNLAAPVFARARRELNVSRQELASPSVERWLSAKRDQVIEWLREAGLSLRSIGGLVNRSHGQVVAALHRQAARQRAAAASPVVTQLRRVAHG